MDENVADARFVRWNAVLSPITTHAIAHRGTILTGERHWKINPPSV